MANVTINVEIKFKSFLDIREEEFKKAVFTAAMAGFDMKIKVGGTLKGYSEGYFGVSFKGKDRKEVKAVAYSYGKMPFDKLASITKSARMITCTLKWTVSVCWRPSKKFSRR